MIRLLKLLNILLFVVPTPLLPLIRLFRNEPKLENSFYTTTEGEKVPLRIYHPIDLDISPAIIIYPGATPVAEEHEAVNILGKAMASVGIRTFLPRIPALKKVLIQPGSVEHMVNAYVTVSDRKDVDSEKIIGCGVSFGGSLFVKACLDDRIKGKPVSVLSYGSYFDFSEAMEFSITGKCSDGDKEYYFEPHDWGRVAFFHNYLEYVEESFDFDKIQEYLFDQIINDGVNSKTLYKSFSNKDKNFIDKILYDKSDETLKMTKKILEKIRPIVAPLSPSNYINEIDFPIYMMHGAKDNMIPFTETVKFANELEKKGKKVNSLISHLYSHSEIDSHKKRVISFIAELWRMGRFLNSMLGSVLD